jgi:hypothetical protein
MAGKRGEIGYLAPHASDVADTWCLSSRLLADQRHGYLFFSWLGISVRLNGGRASIPTLDAELDMEE